MLGKVFVYGIPEERKNYQMALAQVGLEAHISRNPQEARDCVGLLLAGGGDLAPAWYGARNEGSHNIDTERDLSELYCTLDFARCRKPILGICRGIQVLAVAFGGGLEQDIPHHTGTATADRLHPTRAIGLLAELYGAHPVVNSWHHQSVRTIGGHFALQQWAEDGTVEGICHRKLPILGLQWHPERLCGSFAHADAVDGLAVFRWFRTQIEG